MNRRRMLSNIRRTSAQGVNAAAWFAGQSFTSASRGDVPVTQLSIKQLDEAGAGLLPEADVCPDCGGTRVTQQQISDNLSVTAPCAERGGRGFYEEKQ